MRKEHAVEGSQRSYSPTIDPANKSQHIKICNGNPGNPHGVNAKNTPKIRSTRKEVPLYLQKLETEGIDIEQENKCGEVYLMVL